MRRRTPRAQVANRVAIVYARVSTAQQAAEGVSLDAQEGVCRAHAARLGWPIVSVHRDEGFSGKDNIEDRPGLAAAIAAVQVTPGAVLVVHAVSRLARRQRVLWGILDERDGLGVPLSSATEAFDTSTPAGRAMLGMLSVWSALEADMVSARTRDALAHLKAQGRRLGPVPTVEREGGAALLARVRELAAQHPGDGARALAARLNAAGVASVSGRRWHATTVRRALAS